VPLEHGRVRVPQAVDGAELDEGAAPEAAVDDAADVDVLAVLGR